MLLKYNNFLSFVKELNLLKELPTDIKRQLSLLDFFINTKQRFSIDWFFQEIDLTEEYQKIVFGFSGSTIAILNDNLEKLYFSWDGKKLCGILHAKEDLQITSLERTEIFLKGTGLARIWAF